MSYRIVTNSNSNANAGNGQDAEAVIVIVGCGGTGGFLAEAVCRLLIGRPAQLFLIDPDRVEPHNCRRQAFADDEVGQFKAEVLARRLSRRYHRTIGYDVRPYDHQTHGRLWQATRADLPLLIGCVDNAAARAAIARSLFDYRDDSNGYGSPPSRPAPWWLDLGNGEQEGQAFLGNAAHTHHLRGSFQLAAGTVTVLPAPSLQAPSLLAAPPAPQQPAADCAEAVSEGGQSPVINQAMAMLGAVFVQQLLAGTCTWLQATINLTDGVLHTLPADPRPWPRPPWTSSRARTCWRRWQSPRAARRGGRPPEASRLRLHRADRADAGTLDCAAASARLRPSRPGTARRPSVNGALTIVGAIQSKGNAACS